MAGHFVKKAVTVEPRKTATVDFDIACGTASIEGRIGANGTPVSGMTVSLRAEVPGSEKTSMRTDPNGFYRFTNVPAGNATLSFALKVDGQSPSAHKYPVELKNGNTVTFTIETGTCPSVMGKAAGIPEGLS